MATKKKTKRRADAFQSLDQERTKEAASALMAGFAWSESREGHEYWQRIYDRLMRIVRDRAALG